MQRLEASRADSLPRLILLDLMMPGMDGWQFAREIRKRAGLAQIPIVLTTGSNEGRDIADRLGVRSLEKPFDVSRLLELVRSLVPQA